MDRVICSQGRDSHKHIKAASAAFFLWVINPLGHSVSKYQQHAQRMPILRYSKAIYGRIGAGSLCF